MFNISLFVQIIQASFCLACLSMVLIMVIITVVSTYCTGLLPKLIIFKGDLQGTELVLLILFFNSNAIEIFIYCYLANNITHTVRWVPCLQSENKIIKRCRYFRLFCSMIQFQHTYTAAILPNSIQKPFRQCCF